MSFGDSNNPYGQPPQQPPGQPGQPGQGPGYGYPQQEQAGYGYPQQAPQGVPQQGQDPYGYPQHGQQQPYGAYPQQPGTLQANNGYINVPGLGTVEVATMGRRLGARLIDGVAVGVIVGIIMAVGLAGAVGVVKDCDPASVDYSSCVNDASAGFVTVMFTWLAVIAGFTLLYEWLMVSLVGATFGKMAVGLRVVKESTGGNPGLGAGFIRYIIPMVGAFLCYIGALLVYLSPFFDNSGKLQGWHDRAAGTLVVKK
ncbi:RDD family protein [Streptomyces tsukubensis]|uniref:RDD family protein n=1 Tax=Streptomyces tsukubensis TaxID=83656 RepID=A0A1V4A4B0_9ACTN|nr:RDD family protein [Streptomyces tsukubensis]OON74425.1 RDD family protein [Streptomyces tsukubensis]QFR95332.1 RDD family protein [Streptomyces tsukubensis]